MSNGNGFRWPDLLAWAGAVAFLAYGMTRDASAAGATAAAVFAEECSACHLAYPAKLMSAADWSQVLGRLERHYGADASLDPAALANVATHLRAAVPAANAGSSSRPLPRITTSDWFRREHRELPASTWSMPAVRSAANCGACHTAAERGVFDEQSIRLPGGVSHKHEGEHEHGHED